MYVAAHGLGHSFGLGHNTYSDSLMYEYNTGNDFYTDLPEGLKKSRPERIALEAVYGNMNV